MAPGQIPRCNRRAISLPEAERAQVEAPAWPLWRLDVLAGVVEGVLVGAFRGREPATCRRTSLPACRRLVTGHPSGLPVEGLSVRCTRFCLTKSASAA